MHLLVAYASAHGSTAEIAAFMAEELKQRDFEVTVQDISELQTLDSYDAVILGSAIHGQMWLQAMSQFLHHNTDALKDIPLFFFVTCIRVLEAGGYEHVLREYVDHRVLNKLNLKDLTAFAGKLDLASVDWAERWTLVARYDGDSLPASYNADFRDWHRIRTWVRKVADSLLPNSLPPN